MHIGQMDLTKQVMIVAEIGNNHEGSCALAEEMIHLAAAAGADAVKFQTIVPERLVSPTNTARVEQLKRFSLSQEEFEHLAEIAKRCGIMFLSTPFDIESVKWLDALVPAFKIASGDNNFLPLIRIAVETGKPVLLSTGMTTLDILTDTRKYIEQICRNAGIPLQLVLLHCVASYPAQHADANLLAIEQLKTVHPFVGYSDHTLGIDAAVLSVAMGVRVIEKHFTIRKDYSDYRDHQLSADPADMRELVRRVRQAEAMLGDGQKVILPVEKDLNIVLRRSIVARHDLGAGAVLSWDDLDWLRPGGGVAPGYAQDLIGRRLNKSLQQGKMILHEHLENAG